ncbi:MAG: electron transfer flavoprotein subunit alpha/FixB family protein [Elusimicrobiota bacterium]
MADYAGKGIWCVAESRRGKLASTLFELLTAGRRLADERGEPLTAVLIGGPGVKEQAAEAADKGADKVLVIEHESLKDYVDEAYAAALKAAAEAEKPKTILFPASVYGRSLAPRLAVALKAGLAADAVDLELDGEKRLVVKRSCYAGNVIAKVLLKSNPEIATVRPMAFERAAAGDKKAEIADFAVDPSAWKLRTEYVKFAADESDEVDMSGAERIVAGGRGLANAEGFQVIRELAKKFGAAIGASRAAVDAGWIPYKNQVGLTGRSVRPKLYFACGISGQIQHLAGMNASGTIVAINTDADCPMMKLATYAVQGDVFKVVPAICAEIDKVRGA